MPRKKQRGGGGDIPEWVVTYGDLMSLLLCFFILLAAFSELKQERDFQDVVKSIQEAFGYRGGIGEIDTDTPPNQSQMTNLDEFVNRIAKDVETAASRSPSVSGPDPTTSHISEGPRTVVGTEIAFGPGSSELSASSKSYIASEVVPKLQGLRFKVEIRGHAFGRQDRAEAGGLDRMSFERARAVKDFLVTEGIRSSRLVITAVGNSEPKSVRTGDALAMASNRRVQVILTGVLPDDVHPDPNFTNPGAR
ncbi:MAG: flagellar motor protein MotB [Planctomycetota bacterium]